MTSINDIALYMSQCVNCQTTAPSREACISNECACFTMAKNVTRKCVALSRPAAERNEWVDGEGRELPDEILSEEDLIKIDQAWENHKARLPVAKMKNNNMEGLLCLIEMEPNCTVEVGQPLYAGPKVAEGRTASPSQQDDAVDEEMLIWSRSILDDLEADNKSAALSKLMSFLRTSSISASPSPQADSEIVTTKQNRPS
jgi:hypothetical protein